MTDRHIPVNGRAPRTERAVLVFVLLALATLVAVPILVNWRVNQLRRQIQASEPARTLVTSLQFNLVREMSALSEVMLTGDSTARDDYDQALQSEDSIYRELADYARELDPVVVDRLAEVRRAALIWHDRAANADDLLEEYGDPTGPRPQRERRLFADLLVLTRELDQAIAAHTQEVRSRIETAEQLGLWLTVVLGVLAVTAGAAASLLAGRARQFAIESERRRREAEVALEQLARAADVRQRLLQGITHDVKNPLGAVKGYAELLLLGVKAPVQPEQIPLITGVQRSVDGALQIISDLLDLARTDSGRLPLENIRTDLTDVVADALEVNGALAESAGHTLRFEPGQEELPVTTDPMRVRQILQNLISNAVKYTPAPGTITVETELRKSGDSRQERNWAAVRVQDTGPGIPPEMRERIFDEFARIHEEETVQGHGLGLAIARRIARLLGGDLRVEDTSDSGACFLLLLPMRESVDGVSPAQ